jgi:hypothetical protein
MRHLVPMRRCIRFTLVDLDAHLGCADGVQRQRQRATGRQLMRVLVIATVLGVFSRTAGAEPPSGPRCVLAMSQVRSTDLDVLIKPAHGSPFSIGLEEPAQITFGGSWNEDQVDATSPIRLSGTSTAAYGFVRRGLDLDGGNLHVGAGASISDLAASGAGHLRGDVEIHDETGAGSLEVEELDLPCEVVSLDPVPDAVASPTASASGSGQHVLAIPEQVTLMSVPGKVVAGLSGLHVVAAGDVLNVGIEAAPLFTEDGHQGAFVHVIFTGVDGSIAGWAPASDFSPVEGLMGAPEAEEEDDDEDDHDGDGPVDGVLGGVAGGAVDSTPGSDLGAAPGGPGDAPPAGLMGYGGGMACVRHAHLGAGVDLATAPGGPIWATTTQPVDIEVNEPVKGPWVQIVSLPGVDLHELDPVPAWVPASAVTLGDEDCPYGASSGGDGP